MDQEEVRRLVEGLNLSEEATTNVVEIPTDSRGRKAWNDKFEKVVVGKIFAARVVNRDTLRTHIPRILNLQTEADIEIVGDNIFVMVVGSERERRHALHDGPWHFFESLMLFNEPKGMETPTEIQFNDLTIWIQCHNLPIACMNPVAVRRIGETVGKVEEVDEGMGGNCIGQYARVRVTRDITKPLQRCVMIKPDDGSQPHTVLIRYERLPEFCQACGRVGHTSRHCDDPTVDKSQKEFGQWLKAARAMEYRKTRRGQKTSAEKSETSATGPRHERTMAREHSSAEHETEQLSAQRHEEVTNHTEVEMLAENLLVPRGTKPNNLESSREMICRKTNDTPPKTQEERKEKGKVGSVEATPSPQKRKKRGDLKGWKRRAREPSKAPLHITEMADDGMRDDRRRSSLGEEEQRTPKRQCTGSVHNIRTYNELTSEAATQPRRSQ